MDPAYAIDDDEIRAAFDDAEPGADSDEDPRAEVGYREPPPVAPKPVAAFVLCRGACADCRAEDVALHPRCGARVRNVCGECSGKDNRRHVEDVRSTVRALKEAATMGDSGDEHRLMKQLAALVGDHQAGETIKAIRDRISEGAKGGRR